MRSEYATVVNRISQCNICKEKEAVIDGKTEIGYWCYMCWECFEKQGIGLGLGKGQELFEETQV